MLSRLRSIRAKLVGIVGLITISTLGVGFAVVLVNDVRTFRRDMVEHTSLVAHVIGEYSVSALIFRDQDAAQDALAKLADVPMLEHAYLYDAEGQPFANWGSLEETDLELTSDLAMSFGLSAYMYPAADPVVITALITDPEGVAEVTLESKVVAPGAYVPSHDPLPIVGNNINLSEPRTANRSYRSGWTSVRLRSIRHRTASSTTSPSREWLEIRVSRTSR